MNTHPIFDSGSTLFPRASSGDKTSPGGTDKFSSVLNASLSREGAPSGALSSEALPPGVRSVVFGPSSECLRFHQAPPRRRDAAAAYAHLAGSPRDTGRVEGRDAAKAVTGHAGRDALDAPGKNALPSAPAPTVSGPLQTPSALNEHGAAAAPALRSGLPKTSGEGSGWQKYRDDQFLRNPGGDRYYLDENRVSEDLRERESFGTRVGKDLSDVFGNVKNFFGNLLFGSKFRYRDENNEIREATQRGLVGTCVDFFKDLGSAMTFGLWHPDEENGPQGVVQRIAYSGSKLKEALLGDLVEGIPRSVNHMAKNVVLAGLNLVQVVPDATIGNAAPGRKLTTTIFDNGQVLVEYLTDVIPSGDAWFRVHAASLTDVQAPVLYNLRMPEHAKGDVRWQYVRNTPFRKTIETVGTLLADIAAIGLAGQTGLSTNQKQR